METDYPCRVLCPDEWVWGWGGLGRQVCQSSGSPVECGQWEPQGGAAGEHGQWEPREGVGSFLRNLVGV